MKNWEFYESVQIINIVMLMCICLSSVGKFFYYKFFGMLYFNGLPWGLNIFIFSSISLIIPYLFFFILWVYFIRGKYFKDGLVDSTFKESLSNIVHITANKKVRISLLLSVIGGLFGLFSLGNLYNRVYKRFIIEFVIGLIITSAKIITCHNFIIGSGFDSIYYYNHYWFIISCIFIVYYLFTINDTYECCLSRIAGKINVFRVDKCLLKFLGSFSFIYLFQVGVLRSVISLWIYGYIFFEQKIEHRSEQDD